jgi:hypothetical protein
MASSVTVPRYEPSIPEPEKLPNLAAAVQHIKDHVDFRQISDGECLGRVARSFYGLIFQKILDAAGDPVYIDVCNFLTSVFNPNSPETLLAAFQNLEDLAERAAGEAHRNHPDVHDVPPSRPVPFTSVPPRPTGSGLFRHQLHLHQLTYQEMGFVRGSPNLTAALEPMTNTLKGFKLSTEKYGVEVLYTDYELTEKPPGTLIAPFSVVVSQGAATTISGYLLFFFFLQFDLADKLRAELFQSLASGLLCHAWIHVVYTPADSMEAMIHTSIADKCRAAARTRPNICNLLFTFKRLTKTKKQGPRPGP